MLELTCCLSSILFFFAAAIKETGLAVAYSGQLCPAVNFLSGSLMGFSMFYMYRCK